MHVTVNVAGVRRLRRSAVMGLISDRRVADTGGDEEASEQIGVRRRRPPVGPGGSPLPLPALRARSGLAGRPALHSSPGL